MDAATATEASLGSSLATPPATTPTAATSPSRALPPTCARSLTPHIAALGRHPLPASATAAHANAADPHKHDRSLEPAHSEPLADGPPSTDAADDDDDAKHDDTDTAAGGRAARS